MMISMESGKSADIGTFPMKAVSFDLDDTVLRSDLTVSPFSVSVFRRLQRGGIQIIPASGRTQQSMKPYIDQISCVSLYISCNGAEIWNGHNHQLLYQDLFSAELALEIADFAEKHDCYAQVYDNNRFYFNKHGEYADRYAAASSLSGQYVGRLSQFIHEPRNKVMLVADESLISSMLEEAKQQFRGRASVTCSKPIYLEFNPPNATKGNALIWASSYLGINPDNVIAFGDSLNDLSMLQTAGYSVSVSNGWKEILPFCNAVCASNDDDGPARFLNNHFPGKEVGS